MKALILLAFGYLIDFFDLTLFAAARAQILESFDVSSDNLMHVSRLMFNAQALGIVLGGLVSGVWGDKIGRMSSIRVGIFIYSTAILWSAYTTSVNWFICLRFIAGVGLAGELASSVTFMTEAWEGKARDFAISTIYFSGVLGGILATVLSSYLNWKILFITGALSGYALLVFRLSIKDSILFQRLKNNNQIRRGSLSALFLKKNSLIRVINLTLLLVPFWFMVYFVNFGPEIARQIGLQGHPSQSVILANFFIGAVFGTYLFSALSRLLRSRKKTLICVFCIMLFAIFSFLFGQYLTLFEFYIIIFILGITCGYPSIYTALASESFGTNQRTTGTCIVSCFGRGSLVFINFLVPWSISWTNSTMVGIVFCNLFIFLLGIVALSFLEETHERSINFVEK